MKPPLEGLTILDLTRLLPGPFATWVLSSWGARVIKIEEPGIGDYMRHAFTSPDSTGVHFTQLNMGKESVALDLRTPEGKETLGRLVEAHPILIESFRPGTMERLGVGYEDLKRRAPSLIYVSVTGYGPRGDYAHRAGHDLNYQSLSGLVSMNLAGEDALNLPGSQFADIAGGSMPAAMALLAACWRRERTGEGCRADISMTAWASSLLLYPHADAAQGRPTKGDAAWTSGSVICYHLYRTRDGRLVSLSALEPKFFQTFCETAGHPEWLPHHFSLAKEGNPAYDAIRAFFLSGTRDEWVERFRPVDACVEPVLEVEEVRRHPLFVQSKVFSPVPVDPARPPVELFALPRVFDLPDQPSAPAPALGEHTEKVLAEIDRR